VGVLTYSPVDQVRRPKADDETASVGLTLDELDALLSAAEAHGHRSGALVSLLAYNGLRIAEALGADIADYRYQRGHRVLQITRKGGKRVEVPLAPPVVRAINTYLEADHPDTGPLFLADRGGRLLYLTAYREIQRL